MSFSFDLVHFNGSRIVVHSRTKSQTALLGELPDLTVFLPLSNVESSPVRKMKGTVDGFVQPLIIQTFMEPVYSLYFNFLFNNHFIVLYLIIV